MLSKIDDSVDITLKKAGLSIRLGASVGTWLVILLPLAIILGSFVHPSAEYNVAAVFASGLLGASVALVLHLQGSKGPTLSKFNPIFVGPIIVTALLFWLICHKGFFFCLSSGIFASLPISIGVPIALQHIPGTFTLGEITAVLQGILLFLFTAVTNILNRSKDIHFDSMEKCTLILQTGLLGLSVICILVTAFPGLRQLRPILALIVGIMGGAVLPALFIIFKENPILWMLHFITDDIQRVYLLLYWVMCCFFAITSVRVQVQNKQHASSAVRKIFHVLILAVYLPGLAWECTLLYLSSGIALAFLVLVEMIRLLKLGALSDYLQEGFIVFADEKDSGGISLTPIYLLIGCSLPLWIHPTRCALRAAVTLPVLSGLVSVGCGDTAASVIGSLFGKNKWPGSPKSIEGSVACVVAQIALVFLLSFSGMFQLTWLLTLRIIFASVVITIVEAKTDQVDNVALPLLMYILLL
ncbi:dolichol kinase [Neocloeon triangulifer]|uniref:dolichol kinase n=1 Tax=Neocloeon triangulifer TaxID=2078957 RepID=UPI00286F0396|nr:dolichol kinase [Neocloeon triangulifer]